jgi:hypothetical protein
MGKYKARVVGGEVAAVATNNPFTDFGLGPKSVICPRDSFSFTQDLCRPCPQYPSREAVKSSLYRFQPWAVFGNCYLIQLGCVLFSGTFAGFPASFLGFGFIRLRQNAPCARPRFPARGKPVVQESSGLHSGVSADP